MHVDIPVRGEGKLFDIARALHAPGRLSRLLNGGQQHGYQDADDRDDDQQFDQRKTM